MTAVNIYNNTAGDGSAVYVVNLSTVNFYICYVFNNHASQRGTVYLLQQAILNMHDTQVKYNYAFQASFLFVAINNAQDSLIQNTAVENNLAVENAVKMYIARVNFVNTSFIDNQAQQVSPGLTLIGSNSTLTNVTFAMTANTYETDTGFLQINLQSNAIIQGFSSFSYGLGLSAGFFKVIGSSNLTLIDSTLQHGSSQLGSAIYVADSFPGAPALPAAQQLAAARSATV